MGGDGMFRTECGLLEGDQVASKENTTKVNGNASMP